MRGPLSERPACCQKYECAALALIHKLLRSVAPTIGGYLMSNYGFESLGYVGVACNIVALSMVARTMQD